MTTLKLNVDDNVLDKLLKFIKSLPDKSVKIIEQDDLQTWNIQEVSDEEQKDIEDELKNPDCHIAAFSKIVTL